MRVARLGRSYADDAKSARPVIRFEIGRHGVSEKVDVVNQATRHGLGEIGEIVGKVWGKCGEISPGECGEKLPPSFCLISQKSDVCS